MKVRTTRLIHHISTPLLIVAAAVLAIGAVLDSTVLILGGGLGFLATLGLAMAGTHYRGVNARKGLHE